MILGWDIGGVNTKVARLEDGALTVRSRPFELQRSPEALVRVLRDLAAEVGAAGDAFTCAVTMTAELSQMFRTKRDGVGFVLDAVLTAFPAADVRVLTTRGTFVAPEAARGDPIAVAAANWMATARLVAQRYATTLLIDVGTTTTDIIPIVDGQVMAAGLTDPDRLASGELVYTGALRTPVEAIVREVPYRDGSAGVSAEAFALIGDVHLWRGRLAAGDYSVTAPDGREATREFAGERLARVICADRELLDAADITRMADAVAAEQIKTIAVAIQRVRSRHASVRTAVITGLGEFIARDAAKAAGLDVMLLADGLGVDAARYAPAAAVALLCADDDGPSKAGHHEECRVRLQADFGGPAKAGHYIEQGPAKAGHYVEQGPAKAGHYEQNRPVLVIKVGGGLLKYVDHLDRVLGVIADVARKQNVVIVPGGGPFADTVRDVDARLGLGDDEAHWMAVLAMDQSAHLLSGRLANAVVVSSLEEIATAYRQRLIPVLAPSRWLVAADPLPHTWDVTSDSIAAWVAGELGAPQLLLVKPPGASGTDLLDPNFERTRPPGLTHECLPADRAIEWLRQIAGIVKPALETT